MQLDTFFSVSEHTVTFLFSVLLGAVLGTVYDCFRAFRVIFPPAAKRGAVVFEDILFWLIYGFSVFCFAAAFADGKVRFFMFFGSVLGFILYLVTVGSVVIGVIRAVFGTFYRILHKVYSALIEPFVKIFKIICQKVMPLFVINHKNTQKFKKPLKNTALMLYNRCTDMEKNVRKRLSGR